MGALVDLTGRAFGRLTVIQRAADRGNRKVYWLCRCQCGDTLETMGNSLTTGKTVSCGCAKKEGRDIHGGTRMPEYEVWCGMKARCHNANHAAHKNYGGRGITVCERWLHDFPAFLADMGSRPSPGHTIERKDNDQGYSPDNCIWATRAEQSKNQRPRKLKTHCKRGHPRSGDNIVIQNGRQACLACRKVLWKQWAATHRRAA